MTDANCLLLIAYAYCLCLTNANDLQLMVDALYMRNVLSTRDKDALVAQMVCNKDSESCSYRLCDECVGKNSLIPNNIMADTE